MKRRESTLADGLVLVGGGLANGLLAYRLRTLRPELPLVVLERDPQAGGNHTWSFHEPDLTAAQHAWIAPFVAHAWPHYEVSFPKLRRRLRSGYRAVTSERFHAVLSATLGGSLRTGTPVAQVSPTHVELADGQRLQAAAVVDGRGPMDWHALSVGHQKFLGLELQLARPHGLTGPIVMDATVPQHDGYRFVYVLPFTETVVLIEDTCYSDGPALDAGTMRRRVHEFAAQRGWEVTGVLREETGVLPIALDGDARAFWDEAPGMPAGMPRTGLRAALFHPTTGYSLPDAVRLADRIAARPTLDARSLHATIRAHSLAQWRRQGFFRLLNRMLFRAARGAERRRILERFYGLPEPLIRRFYAGQPTLPDVARVLIGRPPIPIARALRVVLPAGRPA